jgi:hypothetical protein
MKVLLLMLALIVGAPSAFAQQRDGRGGVPGKNQGTSRDQRDRMRNDMQDVYRDRNRQERPQQRQLSPQEREQLRRDIDNANRNLKR